MTDRRVHLLPARRTFTVHAHESVLEAALRAGINLPHSCKGGHCAACRARLVEGRVTYPEGRPLGLSVEEEREGYALLCEAHPVGDVTVDIFEIHRADEVRIRRLPCRIERMERLAPDVLAVFLRLPAVEPFEFLAGQYIDIMLPGSRRRSFSLACPPHDAGLLELHVRKVSGGEFTRQLFESLREKALLRIEGPLGHLHFREESDRPAILIAGGTGYAPLRSMVRHLLERREPRSLHLYWGARTRVDLYDEALLGRLSEKHADFRFTPVLSEPAPEDRWPGRTGLVHRAVLVDRPDLSEFDVYAAGPPAMIEAIRSEFPHQGLPRERLFFDSFDYAPDVLARIRHPAAGTSSP